jgi:hypothetical protein
MRNVQQRIIDAPIDTLGALLDSVGGPNDKLWPARAWPPMILDNGLAIGSRGGHGPIRYSVSEYVPGRRVRFGTDPDVGLDGYHEFEFTEIGPERTLATHTINAKLVGSMKLLWPIAIRPLHVAVLRDLFDIAERSATGQVRGKPTRWSVWVRLLRRIARGGSGKRTRGGARTQ